MRAFIAVLTLCGLSACGSATREHLIGDADLARVASLERMNEGTALVQAGRPRAGAAALQEAVRIDPDNRDAWLNLGANHYNEGRMQDARRAFVRAAEGRGEAPASEVAYATALALVALADELDDPAAADELVHEALSWLEGESSELAAAQLLAGTLHESYGATSAANRAYRRAIKLGPSDVRSYVRLGALYADHGFFAEAIEVLRTGTRLATAPAAAWTGMGRTKTLAGDLRGAAEAYREALELDGESMDALFGLGMTLSELGEIDESVGLLERYLQSEPEGRSAHRRAAEWRVAQLHVRQLERGGAG